LDHQNQTWNNNHLIFLSSGSHESFEKIQGQLELLKIDHSVFYEPDISGITATACLGNDKLFKKYKLQ
jgi:hypothetical protein